MTEASAGTDPATGSSPDTRRRILDAVLSTIRDEGYHGASARAIARTGGFNSALIFYHFGSVEGAVLEAAKAATTERVARYRERLIGTSSLGELVGVARELHAEDARDGNVAALAQMLAGAAGSEHLAAGMRECFRPWVAVVEDALAQVLRDSPLSGAVDVRHMAFLVSAMFLGIELMTFVDGDERADSEVFDAMDEMSVLIEELLTLGPVASRILQRRLRRH